MDRVCSRDIITSTNEHRCCRTTTTEKNAMYDGKKRIHGTQIHWQMGCVHLMRQQSFRKFWWEKQPTNKQTKKHTQKRCTRAKEHFYVYDWASGMPLIIRCVGKRVHWCLVEGSSLSFHMMLLFGINSATRSQWHTQNVCVWKSREPCAVCHNKTLVAIASVLFFFPHFYVAAATHNVLGSYVLCAIAYGWMRFHSVRRLENKICLK